MRLMERDPLPYSRMYSFSIAAITNYHKFTKLKNKQTCNLIFKLQFRRSEVWNGIWWAKIKMLSGAHSFLEAIWENPYPGFSWLLQISCIPKLELPHPTSFKSAMSCSIFHTPHHSDTTHNTSFPT